MPGMPNTPNICRIYTSIGESRVRATKLTDERTAATYIVEFNLKINQKLVRDDAAAAGAFLEQRC